MAALPDWLVAHITTTTGMPPGGRYLVRWWCRGCRAMVLIGPDDDWAANLVSVDLVPIDSPEAEQRVLAEGRGSYALRRHGERSYLRRRDHWQIEGSPAGSQQTRGPLSYLVLAEHRCPEVAA